MFMWALSLEVAWGANPLDNKPENTAMVKACRSNAAKTLQVVHHTNTDAVPRLTEITAAVPLPQNRIHHAVLAIVLWLGTCRDHFFLEWAVVVCTRLHI